MFVLFNTSTGKYVAKPGLKSSFTDDIRQMQKFSTKESAMENKCGDEYPVDIQTILD